MAYSDEDRLKVFEDFLSSIHERDIKVYHDRVEYRFGADDYMEWRSTYPGMYVTDKKAYLTDNLMDMAGCDTARLEFLLITDNEVAVFLDHLFYCTIEKR